MAHGGNHTCVLPFESECIKKVVKFLIATTGILKSSLPSVPAREQNKIYIFGSASRLPLIFSNIVLFRYSGFISQVGCHAVNIGNVPEDCRIKMPRVL